MSNYDMIYENQVEMVELSDQAMEAVAGGGTASFNSFTVVGDNNIILIGVDINQDSGAYFAISNFDDMDDDRDWDFGDD